MHPNTFIMFLSNVVHKQINKQTDNAPCQGGNKWSHLNSQPPQHSPKHQNHHNVCFSSKVVTKILFLQNCRKHNLPINEIYTDKTMKDFINLRNVHSPGLIKLACVKVLSYGSNMHVRQGQDHASRSSVKVTEISIRPASA